MNVKTRNEEVGSSWCISKVKTNIGVQPLLALDVSSTFDSLAHKEAPRLQKISHYRNTIGNASDAPAPKAEDDILLQNTIGKTIHDLS
ncbi:hypothetical protein LIER_00214 [Lithospermum erythrorhizon]|uniref:Uncharacterized protein n=1 Tax=Lithospermum erythrorhizon TaxID=34254 RepID=A0AAV3NJ09_LITER